MSDRRLVVELRAEVRVDDVGHADRETAVLASHLAHCRLRRQQRCVSGRRERGQLR
jgi:hypothetical protein